MKLIYCPDCQEVISLRLMQTRKCVCGNSGGYYYDDGHTAVITGKAIPIAFNTDEFVKAVANQKEHDIVTFDAFVIPKEYESIRKR